MRENKLGAIVIQSFALLFVLGMAHQAIAQDAKALYPKTPYPKMAPIDQYLMVDRNAEIALAGIAAPDSTSRDATILVLGRQAYEIAVHGKNDFVCMVGRAWGAPFDWTEFWNPKVRAADCMNPQAARSLLPVVYLRARMVMAGRSKAEIVSAVNAAFENQQLPELESGAMDYMTSKSSYLTDEGDHNIPHLIFYTRVKDGKDWGSGAAGSPVMSSPYWFFAPTEQLQMEGLPPILVFLVAVTNWSDGTPAGQHFLIPGFVGHAKHFAVAQSQVVLGHDRKGVTLLHRIGFPLGHEGFAGGDFFLEENRAPVEQHLLDPDVESALALVPGSRVWLAVKSHSVRIV